MCSGTSPATLAPTGADRATSADGPIPCDRMPVTAVFALLRLGMSRAAGANFLWGMVELLARRDALRGGDFRRAMGGQSPTSRLATITREVEPHPVCGPRGHARTEEVLVFGPDGQIQRQGCREDRPITLVSGRDPG